MIMQCVYVQFKDMKMFLGSTLRLPSQHVQHNIKKFHNKFITSVLLGSQINNSNGTQNDQQDERKQNSKDSYQGHRIFEGTFSLPLPLRRPIFLRLVLPLQSFTRLFSLIYNQNRIITNILQGGLYMIVHIK